MVLAFSRFVSVPFARHFAARRVLDRGFVRTEASESSGGSVLDRRPQTETAASLVVVSDLGTTALRTTETRGRLFMGFLPTGERHGRGLQPGRGRQADAAA